MSSQLELFKANQQGILSNELLLFEANWIARLRGLVAPTVIANAADFKLSVSALIKPHGPLDRYISEDITLKQLRGMVREYAPDGLTEANAMFGALPRLSGIPQMILFRILLDEFGAGKMEKTHQSMYRNLLLELDLSGDISSYLEGINEESYAFVNIYHWLTRRAPRIDSYLGALAYTEMSVPPAFAPYAKACERLGIKAHNYFTEHIGIDVHHTREALRIIDLLAQADGIDLTEAYWGACIAQLVGGEAVGAAVRKVESYL